MKNIAIIALVVAGLSFLFSIFVYFITRLERRKRLLFGITAGPLPKSGEIAPFILLRIHNPGPQAIVIGNDAAELQIDRKIKLSEYGLFLKFFDICSDDFPHTLASGETRLLFCKLTEFLFAIEKKGFKEGTDISFHLRDIEGKKYKSKRNRYKLAKYGLKDRQTEGNVKNRLLKV